MGLPRQRLVPAPALITAGLLAGGALFAFAHGDDEDAGAPREGGRAGCAVSGPRAGGPLTGTFGERLTVAVPRGKDDPPLPGTTLGRSRPGGAVSAKILWRRGRRARGRLSVTGRRLDGAGRLTARIDQGHVAFAPSTLEFSSEGCWRVAARSGSVRARYVVRVVDHSRAR